MSALLGVKDAPISKTTQTFPTLNKIGGEPDHFLKSDVPLECPQCGKMMYLVVQLYCPLDNSPYHRTLYIYTCVTKRCWGKNTSWKVLREQKLDESLTSAASKPMAVDSQKDVWGADEDDWGDEDDGDDRVEADRHNPSDVGKMDDIGEVVTTIDENLNLNVDEHESSESSSETEEEMPPEQQAIKAEPLSEMDGVYMEDTLALSEESVSSMLKLIKKTDDEQTDSSLPIGHLNSYYLNVFEDSASGSSSNQHVKTLLENYSKNEGKGFQKMLTSVKSGQGKSENAEGYEKDDVKYKDASFYKFHKTVSCWPEQCVRYELGGTALPLSSEQLQEGVCTHCGSARQFELQLMPALVSALTFPGFQDYAVEFGTILIFTCTKSCWDKDNNTPRLEQCIVQCEKEQFLLQ